MPAATSDQSGAGCERRGPMPGAIAMRSAVVLLVLVVLATAALAQSSAFVMHDRPRDLPDIEFANRAGETVRLADFRGRLVLLNIWATWCAPCRREMPTLDRLQAELGGPDFEVLALAVDRKGLDAVEKFYAELGLERLAIYVDESTRAARLLGALGLPTTLLIDREGKEIGRLLGPAEWDSPEMISFFRSLIEPGPERARLGPSKKDPA